MNMKKKNFLNTMVLHIAAISFDIVLVVSILGILMYFFSPDVSDIVDLSTGWVDETGAAFSLADFNNYDSTTETMLPQRVYYTVDSVSIDTSIIFRARSCYIDVYVNDELVHKDYQKSAWIYGLSPGSRWHIISLPPSKVPVEICLEVTACYTNSNGLVDNIYWGSTQNVYRKITSEGIIGFIVSTFLHMCGAIIIVLYFYMHKHYKAGMDLLYLGVATFFSAQWSSSESLLWQLFVGHSEIIHLLGYLSLAAIPLSFGMLASYRLRGKMKIFSMTFSFVSAVALIAATFLHVIGILEFHYSLTFIHGLVVILIPLMIPLVLSYTDGHSRKTKGLIIFPLLTVLTVCLATSIIKYNLGSYGDYSSYIRIAILCFLFCLIIYQFNQIAATYSNGMRADMLADLALTDYMTGLYNRTAFNAHTDEYDHIIASFSPLGIIQFDVNNLKTVNDTLGHEKGDMMIKAVADGLKHAFAEYHDVCRSYRTGGDEFLTIINAINADEIYHECIARLMEYCDEFNKQPDLGFTLTIAHGYILTKGGKTLSEAIDEADALMYENKRMLKGLTN